MFADRALSENEILQLCWAAQGITDRMGHRTAPSAGARYRLEIHVAAPCGCYTYDPPHHRLVQRSGDDLRPAMQWAALSQQPVGQSPAVFVMTAAPARTIAKYGPRGERYVHLEAGHAAQNLLLEATAMGLGAVPIGAFDDARLRKVFDLPADREVLYLIPVGDPAD
jgi:SagB-type dehydrogenase family enzyme